MPDVHIHLHDPSPETVAAAVAATLSPPPPAPIAGVKIHETSEGARLELHTDLRKTLLEFGWLPPVDGE